MKRAVAFLLALFIFVAPVTTLVKADVVIGDNDETIINENATILGRKLALLESFSDLALSGVTEFSISNTSDVDTYLDYLWGEVNDAIESLSDGTGFGEISDTLKSKYYTNLVQYKDYVVNRGNYLAQLLPSGSPTTTLLSTYFADNIFGKQTVNNYDLALNTFKALSRYNDNNSTALPEIFTFLHNINNCIISDGSQSDYVILDQTTTAYNDRVQPITVWYNFNGMTAYSLDRIDHVFPVQNHYTYLHFVAPIMDLNITDNVNGGVDISYSAYSIRYPFQNINGDYFKLWSYTSKMIVASNGSIINPQFQTHFEGLSTAVNYLYQHFTNVNIYYNNTPWILFGNVILNPTLDIDGFLEITGQENTPKYELQPNTQIDYDQLYQVIYNAIRDNLPISQGDINYYDSHDTIYSPTIINNYGEEEGDESDLIDTILDYAVIPKFDTAIAQPMRAALTNGVVIMNTSITDVIPNDILLILGACFFLLLFAVVINRMIK